MGWHNPQGWEWLTLEFSPPWARGLSYCQKYRHRGAEREGERKKTSNQRGPKKSLKEPFLLPPSTVSFLFLPPRQALGQKLECQVLDGNGKSARGSCRADPRQGAGRRNGMTAIVKQSLMGGGSRWPCRGPFCYKGSSNLQGQGVSLSNAITGLDCCHGVSRRCQNRDFRVPMGETSLSSTWSKMRDRSS